jgi:hypothetical protein
MKKYLCIAVSALLMSATVSIAAPDKDALMEKENAAWQAFKDKKPDDFKKFVSSDVIAIYAEGFSDMANELSNMQKWDMKSFAITDYKTTSYGSGTVISNYEVKIEGTVDGKDASGTYHAVSVWKKQKGEWMAIFHTNVKAAAAQ